MQAWRNLLIISSITIAIPAVGNSALAKEDCTRKATEAARALFPLANAADSRTVHPGLEAFKKAHPFDAADPSAAQTWVNYQGEPFQVEAYDPKTGNVTLSRYSVVHEKVTKLHKLYPHAEVKVGATIPVQGFDHEVIQLDDFFIPADEAKRIAILSRKKTLSVPITNLKGPLESATHLRDLRAFHEKLEKMDQQPGHVVLPLVGEDVKFLGRKTGPRRYDVGARVIPSIQLELKNVQKLDDSVLIDVYWKKSALKRPEDHFVTRMRVGEYQTTMDDQSLLVVVLDPKNPKREIARYQNMLHADEKIDPTDISAPTPKSDYFEVSYKDSYQYRFRVGKKPEIKVFVPTSSSGKQDFVDMKKIKNFLSTIPQDYDLLLDDLNFNPNTFGFTFATANIHEQEGKLRHEILLFLKNGYQPPMVSVVSDILDRPGLNETFWHELGHHIHPAANAKIPFFEWDIWQDAVAKDRDWVTTYSKTAIADDFTEHLMKYTATDGGRLNPEYRKRFAHRFALLDRLLNPAISR